MKSFHSKFDTSDEKKSSFGGPLRDAAGNPGFWAGAPRGLGIRNMPFLVFFIFPYCHRSRLSFRLDHSGPDWTV
ncbi:MAG: hypothetical protein CMN76_00100 [Spirochaetaceae bacterium]|nr:hypothetical protein [Spirochaetaceae bacterium]